MIEMRPTGLPVPLSGVATDPDGVHYGVASINGDQVTLRCWTDDDEHWEIIATRGVPVRSGDRDIVVTGVLTEEGKRPWIVIGSA